VVTAVHVCPMLRCTPCLCFLACCEQRFLACQLVCEGSLNIVELGEWARVPALDAQSEVKLLGAQLEILMAVHSGPPKPVQGLGAPYCSLRFITVLAQHAQPPVRSACWRCPRRVLEAGVSMSGLSRPDNEGPLECLSWILPMMARRADG
jgi:hypothetical protein